MAKDNKTFLEGRNAKSGQFTSVEKARSNPNTHVVERVPKAGHGDTGRGGKK